MNNYRHRSRQYGRGPGAGRGSRRGAAQGFALRVSGPALREATLHGLWEGEEVLTRSTEDKALRFEWAMVGERGNVARPAHLSMALMTRVENNRLGAASGTSISDEPAVALWDRLLENVKFRVMVPGATPQSVASARVG